jgi:hypothetical protein
MSCVENCQYVKELEKRLKKCEGRIQGLTDELQGIRDSMADGERGRG